MASVAPAALPAGGRRASAGGRRGRARRRTAPAATRRPRAPGARSRRPPPRPARAPRRAAGRARPSAPSSRSGARASAGELAWTVVSDPSWPVFIACSMSSASPPRTSPTTIRSGRIRSAFRTSARSVTSPRPSTLGGRLSSRATCGCGRRSSAASSTVTIRSAGSMNPASAFRSVVLPVPVPPETTTFRRPRTHRSSSSAWAAVRLPDGDQVGHLERRAGELADREQRPVQRQRRQHGVHAAAVGQAGVDHRARLVDPPADRADDAVDHLPQMLLVAKRDRLAHEPAAALGVHLRRAVRDHLGHAPVAQQRVERADADRVVDDPGDQPAGVGRIEQQPVGAHELPRRPLGGGAQVARRRAVEQLAPEAIAVAAGQIGDGVAHAARAPRPGRAARPHATAPASARAGHGRSRARPSPPSSMPTAAATGAPTVRAMLRSESSERRLQRLTTTAIASVLAPAPGEARSRARGRPRPRTRRASPRRACGRPRSRPRARPRTPRVPASTTAGAAVAQLAHERGGEPAREGAPRSRARPGPGRAAGRTDARRSPSRRPPPGRRRRAPGRPASARPGSPGSAARLAHDPGQIDQQAAAERASARAIEVAPAPPLARHDGDDPARRRRVAWCRPVAVASTSASPSAAGTAGSASTARAPAAERPPIRVDPDRPGQHDGRAAAPGDELAQAGGAALAGVGDEGHVARRQPSGDGPQRGDHTDELDAGKIVRERGHLGSQQRDRRPRRGSGRRARSPRAACRRAPPAAARPRASAAIATGDRRARQQQRRDRSAVGVGRRATHDDVREDEPGAGVPVPAA